MDHPKVIRNRNFSENFNKILTDRNSANVTLVSDDHIQFQAHKVVLGAASPVLRNILRDNPHSHPLIYLHGVDHNEVESILQFIYTGEARFPRNRLAKFLKNINLNFLLNQQTLKLHFSVLC